MLPGWIPAVIKPMSRDYIRRSQAEPDSMTPVYRGCIPFRKSIKTADAKAQEQGKKKCCKVSLSHRLQRYFIKSTFDLLRHLFCRIFAPQK